MSQNKRAFDENGSKSILNFLIELLNNAYLISNPQELVIIIAQLNINEFLDPKQRSLIQQIGNLKSFIQANDLRDKFLNIGIKLKDLQEKKFKNKKILLGNTIQDQANFVQIEKDKIPKFNTNSKSLSNTDFTPKGLNSNPDCLKDDLNHSCGNLIVRKYSKI